MKRAPIEYRLEKCQSGKPPNGRPKKIDKEKELFNIAM